MKERMVKYIKSLTEKERLLFCKKQIAIVIKDFKIKEKSVLAEFNYNGYRKGIRGGKKTSLSAKAINSTQAYFKSLDDLKLIIKYL